MCFGNMQTTQQNNGTNTNSSQSLINSASAAQSDIDPMLRDQANSNLDWLTNARENGYTPYEGPRVAADTWPQANARSQFSNMSNDEVNKFINQGYQYVQAAGNAPAQHVGTERVVDQGGQLGAISDYTSPYINQVLKPQLQDLDEEGMRRAKELNSRAAMAGAFGDTGWEFGRARESDLTRRAREAAIGNANQNAYDRAMQLRETDAGRFLDVNKSNANYEEQRLARMQSVGNDMAKMGIMNDQNRLAILGALDKSGQALQAQDQKALDAAYQEFSRATGFPLEVSQMIIQAVNGSPLSKAMSEQKVGTTDTTTNSSGTTTGQTQQPNNSGFNILGSLLGAFF